MPKICLECLLHYRYNQSWARSSTTENKETCRVSIGHGTNLFNFKRAQNRSSFSESILMVSKTKFSIVIGSPRAYLSRNLSRDHVGVQLQRSDLNFL